jgi:hypothetical protein
MSIFRSIISTADYEDGPEAPNVEDVFSTDVYRGTASNLKIVNDINLSGESGMVWIKNRVSGSSSHYITDTARGPGKTIRTNGNWQEGDRPSTLTSFNGNGFSLGSGSETNSSGQSNVSWSFRKSPKFFDLVTYTGTGAGKRYDHNLGVKPGMMIVKRTDTHQSWWVYHRGLGSQPEKYYICLNTDAASVNNGYPWNYYAPTKDSFVVSGNANVAGGTYVAYVFAHDTGKNNVIQCGSFTSGAGNSTTDVDLGWEPQFLLAKTSSSTGGWSMFDTQRGFVGAIGGNTAGLEANEPNVEATYTNWAVNSRGFSYKETSGSRDFIYMAIRSEIV